MKTLTEMKALLEESDTATDWIANAPCRDHDTSVFFPNGNEYKQARQICRSCDYRSECLRYALSQDVDLFGMFGGFTPIERANYRKVTA